MTDLGAFRPRAVVFDLDGTLTDNMAWHARAFEMFVARHGLPAMTMEMRHRIDGRANSAIFPILFGRDLSNDEIKAFEHEKEGAYRELSRQGLKPMVGVVRLLDRLAAHSIRVAVATSAPEPNVEHTLAEIGLADRLPLVVRSDQVERSKPAPDVYLHAAAVLDVDPVTCLAFEDAPVGVAAARAAGMRCVAIMSTFSASSFTDAAHAPDATYRDFDEFLAHAGQWLLA